MIKMGTTATENNVISVLNQGDKVIKRMKCIILKKTETGIFRTILERDTACLRCHQLRNNVSSPQGNSYTQ